MTLCEGDPVYANETWSITETVWNKIHTVELHFIGRSMQIIRQNTSKAEIIS